MWLNRNIIFVTATFVVLILFFSSQVASERCETIIKTRHFTKTVSPNCPKSTTTTTTSTCLVKSTITTTTTTTTTSFLSTAYVQYVRLEKRSQKIICIPDKKCVTLRKHGKCTKIFYCTPTIILKCPAVRTKTLTSIVRSTSLSVKSVTETSTLAAITTVLCPSDCIPYNDPCAAGETSPCQCCAGLICKADFIRRYNFCLPP
ncbi:hypothetical protein Glove_117g114 [Diversispora epigaea]|uniref:CBM1 domain-containing protein n=1 Tax=Diversispora epigaea TaxID=1348612 RepID=A0A397J9Y8_9GLOM|nr:hypothetical protein Glove_117g114 [Diversispora epigaea]